MYKIMKAHSTYTKELDSKSFDSEMLDVTNYCPQILYLSKIDKKYWWNASRDLGINFTKKQEAEKVIKSYREHQGDNISMIRIIQA